MEATKGKIDDYLAMTSTLGMRKLTVAVDYLNTPLEYQYLNQYHGFEHPLSRTQLGKYFNIPQPQQQTYQNPPSLYQQTAPTQYQQPSQYQQPAQYQQPSSVPVAWPVPTAGSVTAAATSSHQQQPQHRLQLQLLQLQ